MKTLIALSLLLALPVIAAEEKKATDSKHLPFAGTVQSVTSRTLTLEPAEGKEPRKFALRKSTEILKGDKPATVEDIKSGLRVTGSFERTADGDTLTKLQLAPKPKAKAKDEPKKKAETKEPAKKAPKKAPEAK